MTDREKVVKYLELCVSNSFVCSNVCPYAAPASGYCYDDLMRDALALLKEQEPRVLNLNEIHRGMVVWLEQYNVPGMLLVIGGSSADDGLKCFVTEDYSCITPYDDDYNKYWRAWTQEPTDEQRKAVRWDER